MFLVLRSYVNTKRGVSSHLPAAVNPRLHPLTEQHTCLKANTGAASRTPGLSGQALDEDTGWLKNSMSVSCVTLCLLGLYEHEMSVNLIL